MMYLDTQQIETNLRIGRTIEQWIGSIDMGDYVMLKWMSIDKEKNGNYAVSYFEVFDEGDEEFLDIYEFGALNPDEPFGLIKSFPNFHMALEYSVKELQCSIERFVKEGMIQDEYLKYLRSKN